MSSPTMEKSKTRANERPKSPRTPRAGSAASIRRSATTPAPSRSPGAKAPFRRSATNSRARDESMRIFRKMDADRSRRVSKEEMAEYLATNNKLWNDLQTLSKEIDQPPEKTAQLAARVALELATGLQGQAAWDAEIKLEQFHQFRKKYMLDPVGHEEFYQRAVFAYFDEDGSGELDEEELDQFLDTIHKTSGGGSGRRLSFKTKAEMKNLILDEYDVNGDKTLSFNEVRGIISGGAAALSALKELRDESIRMAQSSRDFDDDDESEEGMENLSERIDPRLQASRLLSLLETPEEAAANKKVMEELAAMSESDDETVKTQETVKTAEQGAETDDGAPSIAHEDTTNGKSKYDGEEDKKDEEQASEEADRGGGPVATAKEAQRRSSATLAEDRNKGLVLREFDLERALSSQAITKSASAELTPENSEDYAFCDWLESKISPGSAKGGSFCRRNNCIIS